MKKDKISEIKQLGKKLALRFDKMDQKFETEFSSRENRLDNKFSSLEDRFEKKFDEREKRFEAKFEDLSNSLHQSINKRFNRIEEYLDFRLQPLGKIEERLNRMENNIAWLVGAFKKFDETHTILDHQQKEQKLQLENHEYRIEDLEKTKSN